MTAPSVAYGLLSPLLIILGAAVAGVLVEAFLPRRVRYSTQLVLSLGAVIAALVAVVVVGRDMSSPGQSTVSGAVVIDGPTLVLQGTLLLVGLLAVAFLAERQIGVKEPATAGSGVGAKNARGLDAFTPQASAVPGSPAEREAERLGIAQTEMFPLTLFALAGMMLFPASGDLLTMFVALEVLSLPLYLLCGLARRRRLLSQEAALKYFLLGAFSSAFFLYGVALLYGYAGTLSLAGIGDAVASGGGDESMALIGVALLLVGLLFKVGAVPFHAWVPDVYQGAPTPVTGFMAAATKIAAFGAMLRVFYVALPGLTVDWRPVVWVIAIVTMAVGTITAVTQTDVKRMLAYSSIAHAGFILTGVVAANEAGLSSTMFYLAAYGFSTLGAFAVVNLIRDAEGGEVTDMARWAGLGRDRPLVGAMFSLFLLALAGIPLTSGFISKFVVFSAAAQGGAVPLVIVGVVASAVAAYFYVRVIVLMFFADPTADTPHVVAPGALSKAAIAVTAIATIGLGIVPQPLLDLCEAAANFAR